MSGYESIKAYEDTQARTEYYDEQEPALGMALRQGTVAQELERLEKAIALIDHGVDEMQSSMQPVLRQTVDRIPTETPEQRPAPLCEVAERLRTLTTRLEAHSSRLHSLAECVAL